MSQKEKYNDLISAIKEDEEKKEEQNRFDVTLEQIKEALALLQKLLEAIKEAKGSSVITQKGLDAATKSADNAISGICAAIVKAENTPIKAKLDDESLKNSKIFIPNGWDKRNRNLPTTTNSRKIVGRSIANDSQTS